MQTSPVLVWLPSILSLLVAAAAFYVAWQGHRDRRRRDLVIDTKADARTETGLTLLGWTLADRLALEKRLVQIESEIANQRELHDILERLMAKVLHSPHRPELDRLLEKVDSGNLLTDAEVIFLTDWLHEIATDRQTSKGEQTAAFILLALINSRYKKMRFPEITNGSTH